MTLISLNFGSSFRLHILFWIGISVVIVVISVGYFLFWLAEISSWFLLDILIGLVSVVTSWRFGGYLPLNSFLSWSLSRIKALENGSFVASFFIVVALLTSFLSTTVFEKEAKGAASFILFPHVEHISFINVTIWKRSTFESNYIGWELVCKKGRVRL